jgi:hypothetical protein
LRCDYLEGEEMRNDDEKNSVETDPIVSANDSPQQKSRKRRAGYLIVLALLIIALLTLAEWILNGTIIFSNAR